MDKIGMRKNWIDWTKVIGILLVVMGHVDTKLEEANMLISAFHMPLFFVISGYLSHNPSPAWQRNIKLIKTLLVPYLLYQLINYPYWLFASYKMGRTADLGLLDLIIKPINGILIGNSGDTDFSSMICGPMWFVMALFMLKLGFGYLSRLKDRFIFLFCLVGPAIVVLLKSIDIRLVFSIDCALLALPFFCMGYWAKKYDVMGRWNLCVLKQLCIATLCAVLLIFTTRINGFVFMAGAEYGQNVLLFFVQAFAGIFMVFSLCQLLDKVKIPFVIRISSGTLFILGLQGMVLSVIRQYLLIRELHVDFDALSLFGQFTLQFIVGVAVLGILYFPMLLAEKRYPVLVGKIKKLTTK